jgi:hypothetical protein
LKGAWNFVEEVRLGADLKGMGLRKMGVDFEGV